MLKIFTITIVLSVILCTATFAASVSLDVSNLNFGSIAASSAPQMLSAPINIMWNTAGLTNWKMRIYTDNTGSSGVSPNPIYSGSADPAGLIGETTTDRVVPLKIWCANYGPTASPPDVSNTTYWADNWGYIIDYSRISSGERILMRSGTELSNPFPIYFAALFDSGTVAQNYKTSTLIIELIEQ